MTMNEYKENLKLFLEDHANKYEEEPVKEIKSYERHLMIGALLFAMNAKIITPIEEEELYQRYVKY